jgi:hypothetical protein
MAQHPALAEAINWIQGFAQLVRQRSPKVAKNQIKLRSATQDAAAPAKRDRTIFCFDELDLALSTRFHPFINQLIPI